MPSLLSYRAMFLLGVSVACAASGSRLLAAPEPVKLTLWSNRAPTGDGKFETADTPITVYQVQGKTDAPAVVICPGGGYIVWMVKPEGHQIAKWLNEHGMAGIVLQYRFPKQRPLVPLLDAQRAIRTVRHNAKQWGIDPARVGILGFSAGGHVASTAATHFDGGDPKAGDPVERLSSRPNFAVLVYPVVTMGEKTHAGSRMELLGAKPKPELVELFSNEKQVTDKTPPVFLAHAKDDSVVPADNSRAMYEALQAHHVPTEYLELPSGNHGLGPYRGPMWDAWQRESLKWLAKEKILRD